MKGDLLINNKDAWETWGIVMGEGFINSILSPAGNKDFIENESRLEDGKRVLYVNPKVQARDVTLTFNISGQNQTDYLTKYNLFINELHQGKMKIGIPILNMAFTLTHQKSTSFAVSKTRTFSKLSVKFEEPNPTERTL